MARPACRSRIRASLRACVGACGLPPSPPIRNDELVSVAHHAAALSPCRMRHSPLVACGTLPLRHINAMS
eukprot:6176747-Pleurochrysis_carterae.AAC.1